MFLSCKHPPAFEGGTDRSSVRPRPFSPKQPKDKVSSRIRRAPCLSFLAIDLLSTCPPLPPPRKKKK